MAVDPAHEFDGTRALCHILGDDPEAYHSVDRVVLRNPGVMRAREWLARVHEALPSWVPLNEEVKADVDHLTSAGMDNIHGWMVPFLEVDDRRAPSYVFVAVIPQDEDLSEDDELDVPPPETDGAWIFVVGVIRTWLEAFPEHIIWLNPASRHRRRVMMDIPLAAGEVNAHLTALAEIALPGVVEVVEGYYYEDSTDGSMRFEAEVN